MALEDLFRNVTDAVMEAERISPADDRYMAAYQRVSDAEAAIARHPHASIAHRQLAQRSAVRAAIRSGGMERAQALAAEYGHEDDSQRNALRDILRSESRLLGLRQYLFVDTSDIVADRTRLFAGRADDLSKLLTMIAEGQGPVILLSGEPGAGKTSLVCKLIDELRSDLPIHHIVDKSASRDTPLQILQALIAQLLLKHPDLQGTVANDVGTAARDFANLLVHVSRRGEAEVVIIDAVDAIAGCPDPVALFPRRIPEGIKLLLSVRNGDVRDTLVAKHGVEPYELRPLRREEVSELVRQARREVTSDDLDQLINDSAGNPLILGFLLKSQHRRSSELVSLVREFIERVSAKLPDSDVIYDVLGLVAAGAGKLSRSDVRDALSNEHHPRRATDALNAIAELLDHRGSYALFFHDAVHDAVVEVLGGPTALDESHERIVHWLQKSSRPAGHKRNLLISHLLALRHLDQAVSLLADPDHITALHHDMDYGQAFDEWINDWQLAWELTGSSASPYHADELRTSVLRVAGRYFQFLHDNYLFARLRQAGAIQALEPEIDASGSDEEVLARFLKGASLYHESLFVEADAEFEKAEALCNQHHTARGEYHPLAFRVHQFRGLAKQYAGKFEAALQDFQRSREVARATGHRLYEVFSYSSAGDTFAMMGEVSKALETKLEALQLLEALQWDTDSDLLSEEHHRMNLASALTRIAELHLVTGNPDQAEQILLTVDEMYSEIYEHTEIRDRYYLYFVQVSAEFARVRNSGPLKDVRSARQTLEQALPLARTGFHRARSLRIIAELIADEGDAPAWEEARHRLHEALSEVPRGSLPTERLRTLLLLAEMERKAGRRGEAAQYYDEALGLARELGLDHDRMYAMRDTRISVPTGQAA